MNSERSQKYCSVVEKHRQKYINIVMTQVDPDAIGAAFALRLNLSRHGAERIRILYCGDIGHPQNRSIINRYNLQKTIKPFSDMQDTFNGDDAFALVDSSLVKDARLGALKHPFNPIIVIDHHRGSDIEENEENFVWIEDMGSSCSLMIELLSSQDQLQFSEAERYIAVLLALGIYTDTKSMIACSDRDREAYGLIMKHAEPNQVRQLISYPISMTNIDNLGRALASRRSQGSRLVASVGRISPDCGDDISTIVDQLIRIEGITLAIVWGIVGKYVRISARSTDISTPLNEFLRKKFGDGSGAKHSADGASEGGGKVSLDLGFWACTDTEDEIQALVDKRITTAIFEL